MRFGGGRWQEESDLEPGSSVRHFDAPECANRRQLRGGNRPGPPSQRNSLAEADGSLSEFPANEERPGRPASTRYFQARELRPASGFHYRRRPCNSGENGAPSLADARTDPRGLLPEKCGLLSFTAENERDGAGTRTRTADLRFTKPLLYQLSYAGSAPL